MNDFLLDRKYLKISIRIGIPILLQTLITALINFTDNFMVGRLGSAQFDGVVFANEIFFIIITVISGISITAGISTAQYFGSKEYRKVKDTVKIKLIACVAIALLAIIVIVVLPKQLISLYSNNPGIISQGSSYLSIVAFSYLPMAISFAIASSIQEIARPKYTMIVEIICLLLKIVFNYLFIFIFHFGVQGAAVSTIITRVIELSIYLFLMWKMRQYIGIKLLAIFKISVHVKSQILKRWPLIFNELFWSLAISAQTAFYGKYFNVNISDAVSVGYTINNFFYIIFPAVAGMITVLVGNSLGANDIMLADKNSKQTFTFILIVSSFFALVLYGVSWFVPDLFAISPVGKINARYMLQITSAILPAWSLVAVAFHSIRSGGFVIGVILMDSLYSWIIVVPVSLSLSYFHNELGLSFLDVYGCICSLGMLKLTISIIVWSRKKWLRNITLLQPKTSKI